MKAYVAYTPTKTDDEYPDQLKAIITQIVDNHLQSSGDCSKCYDGEDSEQSS